MTTIITRFARLIPLLAMQWLLWGLLAMESKQGSKRKWRYSFSSYVPGAYHGEFLAWGTTGMVCAQDAPIESLNSRECGSLKSRGSPYRRQPCP